MKLILVLLAFTTTMLVKAQTTNDVWINEFHYDGLTNYGESDQNEFVELVMKTSIVNNSTELAKYSLVLYTVGSLDNVLLTPGRGLPYNTASIIYSVAETIYPLSAFTSCPSGTVGFTMLSKPMSILQDIPAAMAIIYDNTIVVQLLSYEKSFNIAPAPAGGAAAGQTTTLIVNTSGQPAMETALTPVNHSIALIGSGSTYSQFTWEDNILRTATPCAVNAGQTLAGAALPLNLLSFTALKQGNSAKLTWVTSEEVNVSRYEIERSTDGTSYKTIGTVRAAGGNGEHTYTYTDGAPNTGKNIYRLKMIDIDGKFNHSPLRPLNFAKENAFVLSPNPAQNKITLQFDAVINNGTIRISNQQGQVVKQSKMNGSDKTDINISELAAGVYVVEVISPTFRQLEKLVIRR